jgi:SAM-dependent methyltransferase
MVFNAEYSAVYDLLYQDVDYANSVALVEKHLDGSHKVLLDVGCGTGKHIEHFKKKHDYVAGIDISEGMLKCARSLNPEVDFSCQDARSFRLARSFDVVVMMSAVLSYQITNDDVLNTFRTVNGHLNVGGLFVFDVWHGPTVLRVRPERRSKCVEGNGFDLVRVVEPTIDLINDTVTCAYEWKSTGKDAIILSEGSETHKTRYFFPKEMELFAMCTGFSVIDISRADNGQTFDSDSDCWHARYVLRKD